MGRCLIWVMLVASLPAYSAETLREAIERAWLRQPAAQAQRARADELNARREAAQAAFPEPPSVRIGNRNDRLNRNQGGNEWEAELALPLWLPGERARRLAVVLAQQEQYGTSINAAKLKVAGEVREAYWQARLAENERALARRKVEVAAELASDVERQVTAGDLARVDLNQARADEASARATLAEAEVKSYKAHRVFEFLTTLTALPAGSENPESGAVLDSHPRLLALQRAMTTAQAKLVQVGQQRRDNPELELGVRRERGTFDEPYQNALMVRFRLPFATDARNRPRIAAASPADATQTGDLFGAAPGALPLHRQRQSSDALQADIALLFQNRRAPDFVDVSAPDHGRIETGRIWCSTALNAHLDFPHVGQVFLIERES